MINLKAKERIGLLFSKLPIKELPIELAFKIFDVYILPLYCYGLPLWLSNCSESALNQVNQIFTKYVKRYLAVPKWANNSITYHLINTMLFVERLKKIAPNLIGKLELPEEMNGYQIVIY